MYTTNYTAVGTTRKTVKLYNDVAEKIEYFLGCKLDERANISRIVNDMTSLYRRMQGFDRWRPPGDICDGHRRPRIEARSMKQTSVSLRNDHIRWMTANGINVNSFVNYVLNRALEQIMQIMNHLDAPDTLPWATHSGLYKMTRR